MSRICKENFQIPTVRQKARVARGFFRKLHWPESQPAKKNKLEMAAGIRESVDCVLNELLKAL